MKQIVFIILLFVLFIGVLFIFYFFNILKTPVQEVKSFYFHYTMGMAYDANVIYEVDCKKTCIAKYKPYGVHEEDVSFQKVDQAFMDQLQDIFNRYQVFNWDGFQKSDKYVLDGDSFSFSMETKDGRTIHASGYMKYPKYYSEVTKELDVLFQSLE